MRPLVLETTGGDGASTVAVCYLFTKRLRDEARTAVERAAPKVQLGHAAGGFSRYKQLKPLRSRMARPAGSGGGASVVAEDETGAPFLPEVRRDASDVRELSGTCVGGTIHVASCGLDTKFGEAPGWQAARRPLPARSRYQAVATCRQWLVGTSSRAKACSEAGEGSKLVGSRANRVRVLDSPQREWPTVRTSLSPSSWSSKLARGQLRAEADCQ